MIVRLFLYAMALFFVAANLFARMADIRLKLVDPEPANLLFAGSFAVAAAFLLRRNFLKYALFIYAASFPLYINHSWRIHNSIFEFFTALLAACLLMTNIKNSALRNKPNSVLMWFLFLFAAICALSLMMLPYQDFGKIIQWNLIPAVGSVFNAHAADPLYALAAINRLLLFIVFIAALSSRSDYETNYRSIFLGTLFGGLWSSLVGLLEYGGFIDLSMLRDTLDKGVRLQSVSGNAGWFAEYLTMTIPYILFGFFLKRGWVFKSILFAVMIFFEVTIILTGARGGWLAYPLTLFFCWLFFYLSKETISKKDMRARLVTVAKVAVSVPLTIAVSLVLVLGVFQQIQKNFDVERQTKPAWSQYVAPSEKELLLNYKQYGLLWRYKNFFVPVERVKIAQEGIALWRERPIFGLGWETYRWQADVMEQIQNSRFSQNRQFDMQFDTPHNFYLQLLTGVGLAGLFIWATMILYAFVAGASHYFRHGVKAAIPVMLGLFSIHQYGLTQDPPYIAAIWMLAFLNLGYLAALPVVNIPARIQKIFSWLACVCCLVLLCAAVSYSRSWSSNDLAKKYGLTVYSKDQSSEKYIGFYNPENCEKGECRWAGNHSEVKLDRQGLLKMEYLMRPIKDKEEPLRLSFILDGKIIARETGLQTGWRTRYIYAQDANNEPTLSIEAAKVSAPKVSDTKSADMRLLSIFLHTPLTAIDLPAQGGLVGLYENEPASDIVDWPEGETPVYRWMSGESCAIQLPAEAKTMYLRNGYPNPANFQVRAYVSMNGKKALSLVFKKGDWVKCDLGKAGSENRIVTINLDRTWNARRDGISADERELGLMVAIPGVR